MEDEEFRAELLDAFVGECREHLAAMRRALRSGAVAGTVLRDVFRRAHSLKGAARAIGFDRVEGVAHDAEALLLGFVEAGEALTPDASRTVDRALDTIEAAVDGPAGIGEGLEAAGGRTVDETGVPDVHVPGVDGPQSDTQQSDTPQSDVPRPDARGPGVPEAGVRIAAAELAHLAAAIQAVDDAVRAFRPVGDGPGALAGNDRRLEAAVERLHGVHGRLALVEAGTVLAPLAAMARELGRNNGLELAVTVRGGALRVDRQLLHALRDPLVHMLRNAVGHNARPGAGRALGAIDIAVEVSAGFLVLSVADDGAGPDLGAIERTARSRGLLPPDQPPPREADLLSLVFEPGFSTAGAVDRVSGRGLGLSIVAEAARQLRGRAGMRRNPDGVGAGVAVRVPLPARQDTVLLVEVAGRRLAVPTSAVTRGYRIPANRILHAGGRAELRGEGGLVELLPLAALFGEAVAWEELAGTGAAVCAVGLRHDGAELGLVVDVLADVDTVLVREPLVVGLDRELVEGIAVIGDGEPVPVLSPAGLVARLERAAARHAATRPAAADRTHAAATARRPPTVLVVDDSITTRTLEKAILQAQGFTVLVAVDGVEALGVLRGAGPVIDVVVADVEMPRLDGFGLLAAMRDDPALAAVPTVLMTSRNAEADIRRGLELGARAYLPKQDFDQGALVATIGRLLP
ncbi:MAG: response regulator [Gluconacetobacter diazotrophicus]|nr:response regulator [Gluconacetobacter diazotrophicus]